MTEPGLSPPPALTPSTVRAIVFDLDGTLVDSYEAICAALNHARAAFDLDPMSAEAVRFRVGRGLEALIAELVGPDRVDRGVELFREHYAEVCADRTFALPGVRHTLRKLHERSFRIAVASNKPARFSTPILEQLGLAPYVARVHGPDTVGSTKPDPTMIGTCLRDLEVGPRRAVYVGDSLLDVESAARAGLPVVLVVGGSSGEEELRRTGQPTLGSLAELATLLAPPGS